MFEARDGRADRVTAKAFWVMRPGHGAIETVAVPSRGPDDVVVRTLFSGISRGTEALVFAGRVPVSERQRMRAPFQEGDFPGPVKYGYAAVGVVEQGPEALVGREVFALYPHQTRFVVPASAAHLLPAGVPAGRAVLAANMETAITGMWDADPRPEDRVVVLGAGTVGCLVGWAIRHQRGVRVRVADVNPRRRPVVEALGLDFADPGDLGDDATLVVHTSGAPAGLLRALELAAPDGRIVEMSWYGDALVTLPLGGAFHVRRLSLVSSQVGSIPPRLRDTWTHASRLAFAVSLLDDRALDVLVTGESAFEDLPQVMARLAASPGDELCHRIRYPAAG